MKPPRLPFFQAWLLAWFPLLCPQLVASEYVAPYVNTVAEDVELMLDLAGVGAGDYVIDLGSGDGRIVIAAAARDAVGHGVELDPELVALATDRARLAGVSDRVTFMTGDIFEADIARATVVTMYLFPDANIRMRPKLLTELRPGTRVVSNAFHMGDWIPDERAQGRTSGGTMLWVIPADVSGSWQFELDGRLWSLDMEQTWQRVDAQLSADGEAVAVVEASLRGDRLTLETQHADGRRILQGRIVGDMLRGSAIAVDAASTPTPWTAARKSGA